MDGTVDLAGELPVNAAPHFNEVHLWRAPLDVAVQLAADFEGTLSHDERARAARMRRPADNAHYIAAHGWLRHLLAGYTAADPSAFTFVADAHGKPRVAHPSAPWLRFNMSHSAAIVVFAIARDREVGVDVEEIRDDVDIDGVSRRVFSARQRHELTELALDARTRAFFGMWTRNEAYLKATGTGLRGAAADTPIDKPPGWRLTEFDVGTGYAAAVAVEGDDVDVPAAAMELAR